MNKLVKTLSILFVTCFMTLAGCNANELSSKNKDDSSTKLIEVPPSYGEKINDDDYCKGGFISGYSHVIDHRSSDECLVFSTKESVDEYAASLETNEDEEYLDTLQFFKGIDASCFSDYYLVVTREMVRPNPAYSYHFDGLFLQNPRYVLRFICSQEEGVSVPEVVTYQFYKAFVSKKHQISTAIIDIFEKRI